MAIQLISARTQLVAADGTATVTFYKLLSQIVGELNVGSPTKLFDSLALTTVAQSIYVVPPTPTTLILSLGQVRFTNTTAGALTVTAYAVPSGGTPSVGNSFLNTVSIAAHAFLDSDIPILTAGGALWALASGGSSGIILSDMGGSLSS